MPVRSRLSLIASSGVLIATLVAPSPGLPAAQALYVSTSGSDLASGTEARPFRTIHRAQEQVRRIVAGGMTGDVTVFIRGGTYFLDAALTFDERDSGRDGYSVTYCPLAGETAEIVGGRPVTGWRRVGEGIYAASLGPDWRPNMLMENGQPATMARTPNEGYLHVADAPADAEPLQLVYAAGDLPARFDYRNAQVLVWAGYHETWDGGKNHNWEASLCPISHVDFSARAITLAGPTIRQLHAHNRYYVRGAREFLDSPGEFCVDGSEGVLYYRPRQTPIEAQTVVGSTTARVLEISGMSPAHPVRDIVFRGLTLSLSQAPDAFGPSMYLACDGIVYVRNAQNVTITDCHIRNSGLAGIALHRCSRGHTVHGNLIEDGAHHGVAAAGYWIGDAPFDDEIGAYVNRGHSITSNHIRRCGRLIGQASGVWLYQSGDNLISHNLIEDMPRYGIRLVGTSYFSMVKPRDQGGLGGRLFGKPVTFGNHLDFRYTRDNRIIRNEIRDCMQDSQDGGGITAYGTGADNLIANNLVHDLHTAVTEGSVAGVYLDDASNRFTVRDNIVAHISGCEYVYPMIIKGYDNLVTNNILADNEARAAVYVLQTPHGGLPESAGHQEELVDRLTFARNILCRNGPVVYQVYPWKETILEQSDHNLIYNPDGQYACVVDWKWEAWADWRHRLDGKFDAHTLLAEPLFAGASRTDYGLLDGSPALEVGFTPIDASNIGLLPDFRFAEQVR